MSVPEPMLPEEPAARGEFVDEYGLWIKREALRVHAMMPWAEVDELIQWGAVALLEAKSRFDATRGTPFEHFVRRRVRGAMLDSLRREGSHARRLQSDPGAIAVLTMGGSSQCKDPLDELIGRSDGQTLTRALADLTEQQRLVLQLFYFEELNNKEVAEVLNVSESYASRIRRLALEELRDVLTPMLAQPAKEHSI